MNEQALQDSYNLFKSKGYGKSFDDYKNLLRTNSNALNDSYNLFKSGGYNKSIDEYKVLMGVGGTTPVVKKKESTSKDTGSLLKPVDLLSSLVTKSKKEQKPSGSSVSGKPKQEVFTGYPGKEDKRYKLDTSTGLPVWKEEVLSEKVVNGKKSLEFQDKPITNPARVVSLNKQFNKNASTDINDNVFTGYPGKELNEYKIENNTWKRRLPGQTKWVDLNQKTTIDALNNQFKKDVKYSPAKAKFDLLTEDEDAESKRDLDGKLTLVNSKLIGGEEEGAVKKLKEQFPLFKFVEQGMLTDEILVIAPNDKKIKISLDNWTHDDDLNQSSSLREFIKANSASSLNTKEEKMLEAQRYEDQFKIKPVDVKIKLGEGVGDGENLMDLTGSGTSIPLPEKDIMTADIDAKLARSEYFKERKETFQEINDKHRQAISTTGSIDNKDVRNAYANLNNDTTIAKSLGSYMNDIADKNKSINKEYESLKEYSDQIKDKVAAGEISEEDFKNIYVPKIQQDIANIEKRSSSLNDDVITATANENSINKSIAENLIINSSKGSVGGGISNNLVTGLTDILRIGAGIAGAKSEDTKALQKELVQQIVGSGTTEEYMASEDRSALTKTLFSLSKSMGQLATGSVAGKLATSVGAGAGAVNLASTVPFYAGGYYEMRDQFEGPEFADVSDAEKVLMSTLYGTASGILEKYGLTKSLSKTPMGKGLTNTIIKAAFKDVPKNASAKMIEISIENSIKKQLVARGVNTVGAYIVEASTEAAQELAQVGLQEAFEVVKGNNYFDNGTGWDIASRAWEAAYLGGLGGAVMGTVSQSYDMFKDRKKINSIDSIELMRLTYNDANMRDLMLTNIKAKIINKEITPKEGKDMFDAVKNTAAILDKLPNNLSDEQTLNSVNLLVERSNIEKEIAGKDENLVATQKARVVEINNELKNISENATKESNIQEVTAEGSVSEYQGTGEGQQEDGVGQGIQRDTTVDETNLGDSNIPGQVQEEVAAKQAEYDSILSEAATKGKELKDQGLTDEEIKSNPEFFSIIDRMTTAARELDVLKQPTAKPTQEEAVAVESNDAKTYSSALSEAKAEMGKEGPGLDLQVSSVSEQEAQDIIDEGGKVFMTEDGNAGAYVKKDGYMGGLFKSPKSAFKSVAKVLQDARIKAGGYFMEAYGTKLEKMYIKNGFRPVARIKFNEEYAPEGWDAEGSPLKNKPDVVFFTYDPNGTYTEGEGQFFEDYDAAYEFTKSQKLAQEGPTIEQEVEAIGQLLSGTDQEIDQQISKVIPNKRMAKIVAKARKSLSIILPDVNFKVYKTNEEYQEATKEPKDESSGGTFDIKTNTIHINLSLANARTVAHEVFHAILINKVGLSNAAAVTKKMVEAISSKIDNNPELKKKLDNFLSNYEENIKNEEKLAELVGMLAENYNSFSASVKDIITRWINKLANIFGLDPFNTTETYDILNTIARKVAKGKVISDVDVKIFKGGENIKSPSEGLTTRKQYGNNKVKVEVRYFEQEKMDELIKKGLVQEVDNLSEFNGQRVVTTSPDDMLVGSIYVNGKEVATGNGGIFFVTKFGDVWANSNETVTKNLASAINESSKANGGKAYLVLVKGSDAKLVSSPQGVTSSLAVTESMLDAGLFSLSDFRAAIRLAVKDAGGNISLSQNGSAKTLKNELDSFFSDVTASTFEKRGNVLRSIIANLAKVKRSEESKREIIKFLNGDITKGLGVGVTVNSQSLVDLIANVSAEELTKGLNVGDIYGVIEIDGEVKVFQDKHQSYPYHIKMVDKDGKALSKKPVLILPKNRKNGREILTSIDGQTFEDLGSGFSGKVGATANLPYGKGIMQDGANRKQLSPKVSEKLTDDGKGNFVFHHYSNQKRDVIKPGTGENIITGKEEGGALSAVGGLAMYYTMDNQVEPGVGNVQHTVLVPNDKVYDFNKDPEGFYDEAKKRFEAARPSQSFGNPNYQLAFITQVANENGYDMVVAKWRNNELRAQTTMPLEPAKENIPMQPIAEETYKVGDDVEVYGSKGKVVSIDGDVITYKGEGVSGDINFKRFPKNISKQITPRKQVVEDAAAIEESMEPRKQKPNTINDIVRITRAKGFSDAAIREYLKQQGYTDKQATAAINEYNINKEDIYVAKEGGVPTTISNFVRYWRKRLLSARAFLPRSIFKAKENKEASVARNLNIVTQVVKDFNRLYARYKGDKKELLNNFDAYIRGDKDVELPDEFLVVANSMRNQIDSLSNELISIGAVDEYMAQTIKNNLGQYLTRSYELFDNKNWKGKVKEEVIQKAKNLLRSQYRAIAEEQAAKEDMDVEDVLDTLVDNEIDEMLTSEGMNDFMSGSKLGAKNLSVLKERKDIPIEIRMLFGEYTDPGQNYARTVLKLSALAANHKFLTEIKQNGMGVYFYEKNDPRRPKDFNTKIATEGSKTMAPLNGLYTTEEMAKGFMSVPSQINDYLKLFMKFQSSVRWAKTIGSVATHIKNVIGNVGFVWINGHFSLKEIARSYSIVKNDFSNGTNQQKRDKMNEYISLGIVKQSAGLGEIMDMFKDADWDTAMAARLSDERLSLFEKSKKFFLQKKKKIEDAYQAEDDFFKIIAYEVELSRYSEALFNKPKSELTDVELKEVNDVVVEIVKNTYPTYDRIPEAIKMIRRAPLVGNFVSFQAESYRTAFNTIALAKAEITSKNPKIQAIGAKRITGATTYLSTKSAILAYFSNAAGVGLTGLVGYLFDDEDEDKKDKDIRNFVAPWSKNSDLLMLDAKPGQLKYIDFTSSDPHGALKKVMNSFFLGESLTDSFSSSLLEVFTPFLGEDMVVEAVLGLKNNQDKYGNPIFNTEESLDDQILKISAYMYKLVEPGTVSSIRRGAAAESKSEELLANITGYRIYDVDINKQFGYSIKEYSDKIADAKKIYNSAYYNEEATEAEKTKAYNEANKAVKRLYLEVSSLYNSAERLGAMPDDLKTTMKDFGNMSGQTITEIQSGKIEPLKKKDEEGSSKGSGRAGARSSGRAGARY